MPHASADESRSTSTRINSHPHYHSHSSHRLSPPHTSNNNTHPFTPPGFQTRLAILQNPTCDQNQNQQQNNRYYAAQQLDFTVREAEARVRRFIKEFDLIMEGGQGGGERTGRGDRL